MKFMQRFKKGEPVGSQNPKDSVLENDPIGVQLKKWQDISTSVELLIPDSEIELKDDKYFAFDMDPTKHREFEFKKGTIIKKHPDKEVVSEVSGESSGTVPEYVSIGRRIPEELPNGTVEAVYRTMFIVNPSTQEIVDYTDPEFPNGKIVKNTNSLTFLGIMSLIKELARKHRRWE